MTDSHEHSSQDLSGDELVRLLSALSNPHRLRILAVLAQGAVHVSQLAREVRLSRPLVHMHLQRLEAAGLVTGRLELSSEGRALKFFEVRPFALRLTPEVIAAAAKTVTTRDGEGSSPQTEEEKP
jgi:DNA-binding transcriptional ArsR family regulator